MRNALQRFTCFPLHYYVQFAFILENCSPATKCVTKTGNVAVQMRISVLGLFHMVGQTTTRLYTIYVCIYRVQNVFLRCPTPRLHCFLSSHWPSLRFLSFMAFFIPSIQFFFDLPRALFCFGIHFNAILGSLSSAILFNLFYNCFV